MAIRSEFFADGKVKCLFKAENTILQKDLKLEIMSIYYVNESILNLKICYSMLFVSFKHIFVNCCSIDSIEYDLVWNNKHTKKKINK